MMIACLDILNNKGAFFTTKNKVAIHPIAWQDRLSGRQREIRKGLS